MPRGVCISKSSFSKSSLRPEVIAAREKLAKGRAKVKRQHESGSSGLAVCKQLADVMDTVVLDLFDAAVKDIAGASAPGLIGEVALVPLGGYGRRDVAPYSDADLMLLHTPKMAADIGLLAQRLVQDLCDVGFDLGFSVRTPADTVQSARGDATIFTSLVEGRYLSGSVTLFTKFARDFQHEAQRGSRKYIGMIEQARAEERTKYAESAYLLRPSVKRSPGTLRGLQLLRWIGFAHYGLSELGELRLVSKLSDGDVRVLREAREFLLRLRNEMHFHAGKAVDVLDRSEQVRLAEAYQFQGDEGLLPVEKFMRHFFQITQDVRYLVANFVADARPSPRLVRMLAPVFSRAVQQDYRIGPVHIAAKTSGLEKLRGDLTEVLRLANLANRYNKRIAGVTWQAVVESVPHLPDQITPQLCEHFRSLLSQPAQLGTLLRRLLELGVLEKIIPAFAHARCLLQFNEYHKYTVDEHCILTVESATGFAERPGPLGEVYRGIKKKDVLHLALLVHDLGKGFAQDHSIVGAEIALQTARRLGLSHTDTEIVEFLVLRHLDMTQQALWRDIDAQEEVLKLARQVGTPEVLQMLYVLSAADLAAVGPEVLNDWKLGLLTQLYDHTMRQLGGEGPAADAGQRLERRRREVRELVAAETLVAENPVTENPGEQLSAWFERQIDQLPGGYLLGCPASVVVDELKRIATLKPGRPQAWAEFLPDRNVVQYTVATLNDRFSGVFHRLTGVLTSQGLQIHSAQINTLADGVVMDRFLVTDTEFSEQPPAERLEQVRQMMVDALVADQPSGPPKFRSLWQSSTEQADQSLTASPSRVRTDNSTSDEYTILDVFAPDRTGLLYAITRAIHELGLSVAVAKIGTHLDQVVDVFYVTDRGGEKIVDEDRLEQIRQRLLKAVGMRDDPLKKSIS